MGETKRIGVQGLRERINRAVLFQPSWTDEALSPSEALALVEAVEAAREVRKRHPFNAESADRVLDGCLAKFDFSEAK